MPALRDEHGRFIKATDSGLSQPTKKSGLRDERGRFIKATDRGLNQIIKKLEDIAKSRIAAYVGVQGVAGQEVREDGQMTNAYLASIHEFGTRDVRIPSRSFLRSTFDEQLPKFQAELDKIAKGVFSTSGGTVEGQLMVLGEQYRAEILNKIKSGIPPPLAPSTLLRKGGETTPLIGKTGALFRSITSVVERGVRSNE